MNLKSMRQICQCATRGPWENLRDPAKADRVLVCAQERTIVAKVDNEFCDAEFIATFNPATCLALLDAVEAAQEYLGLIVSQRENFVEDCAENSVHFASEALASIREKLEGVKI